MTIENTSQSEKLVRILNFQQWKQNSMAFNQHAALLFHIDSSIISVCQWEENFIGNIGMSLTHEPTQ